jgi:hypothetical protein
MPPDDEPGTARATVQDRPPAYMTSPELRAAIERTPARTTRWHILVLEAKSRPAFPAQWLPQAAASEPGEPDARAELKRMEWAHAHAALRTYTPAHLENPLPGQWSASWWQGPRRHVESREDEHRLLLMVSDLFGGCRDCHPEAG